MDDNTLRALQSNYQKMGGGLPLPQYNQPQAGAAENPDKPKRSGWKKWIAPGLGIAATLAAAPFTGGASLAGTAAILGGAGLIGGGAGEWITQKLNHEKTDLGAVAKEGLINGALSAVPLGRVGQGVKAGAKAIVGRGAEAVGEQALKEGGEQAAARGGGKLTSWLSGKLLKGADDTALRATQLSGKKEALKGFEKRFGEDLGTYIRKNNLIGATGKDVEEGVISGLNKKYAGIVSKIDKPITSSDVLAQNMQKGSSLEKLLKSGSTENKRLADDVFAELDTIFKEGGGKGLSAQRVAELKSEYQNLAKNAYKLGSNTKASVNEKVAEYLKKTLQGVSGSDELKVVGKEIDKAYKAADLLASAAQNGRGTLSFGMTDLLAATPGAAIGGLPGAAVAVGAKKAINSPQVQSFIASKLASAGERLAGAGASRAAAGAAAPVVEQGAKQLVKQTAKSQVIPRSLQGLAIMNGGAPGTASGANGAQSYDNPNSPFNPASPNYNPSLVDPNAVGGGDIGSVMSESPYSREAMRADIMRDPKNADQYAKIYELMNPQGSELTLSDSAISRTTDAQKALGGLDELDSILADGYAGGKVSGNLRKLNPFDSKFQTQQASIDRIRQIVGKALEGGVLRKEDEDKYKKILPTMQDQPDVYRAKVAQLRSMIQADMQSYLQLQQGYGKGAGQAGGADIQQLLGVQ